MSTINLEAHPNWERITEAQRQNARLIEAALVILRRTHRLGFKMATYAVTPEPGACWPHQAQHECATSCCFLGYVAALAPRPWSEKASWSSVLKTVGIRAPGGSDWMWLFCADWPDCRLLNAKRLLAYLGQHEIYKKFCDDLPMSGSDAPDEYIPQYAARLADMFGDEIEVEQKLANELAANLTIQEPTDSE